MKALSIMQPWAQLIAVGIKPVENRTWPTTFRGPFAIHAGKKYDIEGHQWLLVNWEYYGMPSTVRDLLNKSQNSFPRGGIIGQAEIVDCVTAHPSPFFNGPYGFVIAHAREITPPIPLRGMLGFFDVELLPL